MAKLDTKKIQDIAKKLADELKKAFDGMNAIDTQKVVDKLLDVAIAAESIGTSMSESRQSMVSDLKEITTSANSSYKALSKLTKLDYSKIKLSSGGTSRGSGIDNSGSADNSQPPAKKQRKRSTKKKTSNNSQDVDDSLYNVQFLKREISAETSKVYKAYRGQPISDELTEYNKLRNDLLSNASKGQVNNTDESLNNLRKVADEAVKVVLDEKIKNVQDQIDKFKTDNSDLLKTDPKLQEKLTKLEQEFTASIISPESAEKTLKKLSVARNKNNVQFDTTVPSPRDAFFANNTNSEQRISDLEKIKNQYQSITPEAEKLNRTAKELLKNYLSLKAAWGVLKQLYKNVVEIDTAMTELKKVTDETNQSYSDFLDRAATNAQKLGSTLTDYINATSEFARLGYNLQQSEELANAAVLYYNVGDAVSSVSDGAGSIISTMKAFGESTYSAMQIVDEFNKVGNEFAITSGGIGTALTRSASALAQAGNTLEESIALIATGNTIIRNEAEVGNALKTLSLRVGKTKSELEALGEDSDYALDSKSAYRDTVLAATRNTSAPVDIMKSNGEYKTTYEILEAISKVWDEIDQKTQNSLLYNLGGLRQSNVLAAIIENFDIAKDALESASNADGSALAENEKYLNSIQGKTNQLKSSVEELSSTIVNSDAAKTFLDIANWVAQTTNDILKLNSGLGTTASIIVGILASQGKLTKDTIPNLGKTALRLLQGTTGEYSKDYELLSGLDFNNGLSGLETSFNNIQNQLSDIIGEKTQSQIKSIKDDLEGLNKNLSSTWKLENEKVQDFQKTIAQTRAAEKYMSSYTETLTSLKNLLAGTVITWAATWAFSWGYEQVKNAITRHEQLKDTISEEKSSLETLQDEYDKLSQKASLTDFEEKRLEYLRNQIAYYEKELKRKQTEYSVGEYTKTTNTVTRTILGKEKTAKDKTNNSIKTAREARDNAQSLSGVIRYDNSVSGYASFGQLSDKEFNDIYSKQIERYQDIVKTRNEIAELLSDDSLLSEDREKLTSELESLDSEAEILQSFASEMQSTGRITVEFFDEAGNAAKTFSEEIKSWNTLKMPIIDDFKEVLSEDLFNKSQDGIQQFYDYFANGGTDLAEANKILADSISDLSSEEQDLVLQAVETYNKILDSVNQETGIAKINEEIDQTRSVLQQLESASNEYASYGRISLQTLEQLAQLEPKYLALLVDENGQLNLNAQSVRNLQQARIDELRVGILQQTTNRINQIGSERAALQKLTQMTALRTNTTLGMAEAELKRRAATAILAGGRQAELTRTYLKQAKAQMAAINGFGGISDAQKRATDSTNAAKEAADAQKKAAEKANAALKAQGQGVIDALDKQKDKLQDDLDALNDKYDAEDKEFELQKKIVAYQQAMANKTVRVYTHEDGWVYQSDATATKDARDALTEYQRELDRTNSKNAIQEQIDAIDALKDKINDSMSLIGTELDDYNNKMRAMNEAMGMSVDELTNWADAYNDSVIGTLVNGSDEIAEANSAINDSLIATGGYFAGITDDIQGIIDWIDEFEKKNGDLKKSLEAAGVDLSGIDKLYKDGKISIEEYINVLDNLNQIMSIQQLTPEEYIQGVAEGKFDATPYWGASEDIGNAMQSVVDKISNGETDINATFDELANDFSEAVENSREHSDEATGVVETLQGKIGTSFDKIKAHIANNMNEWNRWANSVQASALVAAATIDALKEPNVNTAAVGKAIANAQNTANSLRDSMPKFHKGGLIDGITANTKVSDEFRKYMGKLDSNEVPIIRQSGEWVLTRAQQKKIMDYSDFSAKSRAMTLSIGDIVINNPVGNVDDLSKAIINKLPTTIMQNFG